MCFHYFPIVLSIFWCKDNLFNFLYHSVISTDDGQKIMKVSESEIIPPLEETNGQGNRKECFMF
jgi:hypothetical protein